MGHPHPLFPNDVECRGECLGAAIHPHRRQPARCEGPSNIGAASLAANARNEDRYRVYKAAGGVTVATVADGHGSFGVSEFVIDSLPQEIAARIGKSAPSTGWTESVIAAYEHVDNLLRNIVYTGGDTAPKFHEGSCVLSAILSPSTVTIANSGDSRAFLIGSPRTPINVAVKASTYDEAVPEYTQWVSEIHTADSAEEQARLRLAHPHERDVVHCRQKIVELDPNGSISSVRWAACYVKGRLQPTRALGDFYLKDLRAAEVCPELVPANAFTPPYIQATPTVCQFARRKGEVLVLGTDGLWDYVGAAAVVDVVKRGIAANKSADDIAASLVETALEIAAEATAGEVSLAQLKAMPTGADRRNIHDDITVVVILL